VCIYVRGETCICICMHMREGVTISLEEEHNSYRRIDWRQLDERSEVMVGNGTSKFQKLRSDQFSRARGIGSLNEVYTGYLTFDRLT